MRPIVQLCSRLALASITALSTMALCGCAGWMGEQKLSLWEPKPSWWQEAMEHGATLRKTGEDDLVISPSTAQNLRRAQQRLSQISGLPLEISIATEDRLNAFALYPSSRRRVSLSRSLVEAFGHDPDVLSYVMAHELAHHQLGHVVLREQFREGQHPDLSMSLFARSDAGNDGLPSLDLNALNSSERMLSWELEFAADRQAMVWMKAGAGNGCSALRFLAHLQTHQPSSGGFLSSHPSPKDRLTALRRQMKSLGMRCT